MYKTEDILKDKELRYNVNKNNTTNVDNVGSDKEKLFESLISQISYEEKDKPKAVAEEIATKLNDTDSLNFHLRVARANEPQILLQCLAITIDAKRSGLVKSSLGGYYVGVLRKKGVQW